MIQDQFALWGSVVVICLTVAIVAYTLRIRRFRKECEKKDQEYVQKHAERKERQARDSQLNHGRSVYKWLSEQLKPFESYGIRHWKMENNGGMFSIDIQQQIGNDPQLLAVVRVDFDFVKFPEYQGHIFYGTTGPDILFPVISQGSTYGLDRLVLDPVRRVAEQVKERQLQA